MHHLVDHVDPSHDFNLAEFVRSAERAIAEIAGRGKLPIVVGGTGLYLRGLLRGVVDAPPRDPDLRVRLYTVARRRGTPTLHRMLGRLDPASAERLAPGDTQRIVRAIELASAGSTWSARLRTGGTWASGSDRYPALKIGLDLERDALVRRLDARVDRFFDAGLEAEVRRLLERGVPRSANAFKAIGYREVLAAIDAGRETGDVRDEVKRSTRRYAKRQRTWFRKEPGVVWLDAGLDPRDQAERVIEEWCRFTAG